MHRIRLFYGLSTLILFFGASMLHGYVKALLWCSSLGCCGSMGLWVHGNRGIARQDGTVAFAAGKSGRGRGIFQGFLWIHRNPRCEARNDVTRGQQDLELASVGYRRLLKERRLTTPVVDPSFRKTQVLVGRVLSRRCANTFRGCSPGCREQSGFLSCHGTCGADATGAVPKGNPCQCCACRNGGRVNRMAQDAIQPLRESFLCPGCTR